jgi:pimeloyl-ACP methyl ester carboxylesterase
MTHKFNHSSLAITFKQGDTNKRPFLFVHGNTQNDTCGKALLSYFRERGHTICSYDLPGHGNTPLETEDYKFTDLIDLNFQVIKKYKLNSPILCGHSLGSMIQSGTIANYQLNNASLIICGGLDGNPIEVARRQGQENIAQAIEEALAIYIEEGSKLFKHQGKYDYFENRALEDSIMQIINLRNTHPVAGKVNLSTIGDFSAREKLIEMNTPVLVLHGVQEEVIPKTIIDRMLPDYQNIQVEWYPNNGHCAFYQQPKLTNDYLDKHYSFISK